VGACLRLCSARFLLVWVAVSAMDEDLHPRGIDNSHRACFVIIFSVVFLCHSGHPLPYQQAACGCALPRVDPLRSARPSRRLAASVIWSVLHDGANILTAFDGFQQTCRFRQLQCATVLYWLPYTGMGVMFTTGGGKRCALFEVSVEPRRGDDAS
jgi:hypothetical protein